MRNISRRTILFGLSAATLAQIGLARRAASDKQPKGTRTIETSYGNAEVYYDEYGVPHIEVANEGALYYAVGYVQARDRLFQMDLGRRRMRVSYLKPSVSRPSSRISSLPRWISSGPRRRHGTFSKKPSSSQCSKPTLKA
jgi:hypothetical protein